jgi:DNA processing protein
VLVRGAEDVLEELDGVAPVKPPPPKAVPDNLDPGLRGVLDVVGGGSPTLDDIVQRLGLPVAQVSGMLLQLEMKRLVRRVPGGRYERA